MYEERRNKFSLRDSILVILLVILFIFIIIWLFPTKSYLENNISKVSYVDYLTSMENAAKDYFTTDRMPSEVGDSIKLTLGEMLDNKMVLGIGGNAVCDTQASYVEVTKMDDNYQLRTELSCKRFSDYKITTIGCRDYCSGSCTTKKEETTPTPIPQSTKKYTVTFDSKGGSAVSKQVVESGKKATKPANPTKSGYTFIEWTLNGKTYNFNSAVTANITLVANWKQNPVVEVSYEYSKYNTSDHTYTDWSSWSSAITATGVSKKNYVDTATKQYDIIDYGTKQSGTTQECTTTQVDEVRTDVQPANTTVDIKVETKAATVSDKTTYTDWVDAGKTRSTTRLTTTSTTKYTLMDIAASSETCVGCGTVTYFIYKVETREATTVKTYTCPSGYKQSATDEKTCVKNVEVYSLSCAAYGSDYKLSNSQCVKQETVKVNKEVCNDVPLIVSYVTYRYRTLKTYTETTGSYSYEYSSSNNDTALISKGYKLTGKVCTTTNGAKTCK